MNDSNTGSPKETTRNGMSIYTNIEKFFINLVICSSCTPQLLTNTQFAILGFLRHLKWDFPNPLDLIVILGDKLVTFNFQLKHACVLTVVVFVHLLKYLIFGTLTEEELLILSSKAGHTIWEFVTGFLVFYTSAEIDHNISWEALKYGGLFLCVLLVKFFGFLIADRVHKLYFAHPNPAAGSVNYGYLRLGFGIVLLNFINLLLLYEFVHDVMWQGLGSQNVLIAIFGSEVLNHCPSTVSTSFIYVLNCYESLRFLDRGTSAKKRWRRKKLGYIYALEFLLSLMRLGMTTVFSLCFLYYYTLPFHSMPSSYLTLKMTVAKARALIDLLKRDIVLHKLKIPESLPKNNCIICYENLQTVPLGDVRAIVPCEHSFHYSCIKRWLKVSPTCPICRQKV